VAGPFLWRSLLETNYVVVVRPPAEHRRPGSAPCRGPSAGADRGLPAVLIWRAASARLSYEGERDTVHATLAETARCLLCALFMAVIGRSCLALCSLFALVHRRMENSWYSVAEALHHRKRCLVV